MEEIADEDDIDATTFPVINHIEDMVLLFLKQLAMPGRADEDTDTGGSSVDSDACDDGDEKEAMNANNARKLTRADYKIEIPLADRRKRGRDGNDTSVKVLRYPRKCKSGSVQSIDLAHESTLNGVPATKRQAIPGYYCDEDIYYRDVSLFKSQRVVDELVDDIAATFDVDRSDLSIRSSSKGLVCSSGLSIELLSGETIQCKDTEGSLIPAGEDIVSFTVDEDISWVLVVEKEAGTFRIILRSQCTDIYTQYFQAVFQTLCRVKVARHENMPGSGIIITGKGYPDVATRHLVKSLADALPKRHHLARMSASIPFVALVDGDPYGLDILSVYKYGSQKMRHEGGRLATRRIKWLGLWASELQSLGIGKEHLLPINKHDERKALAMLSRRDVPLPGRWKKEMQYMLHSRRKAEIEILSTKISDQGLKSPLQAASGVESFISNDTSLEASLVAESSSAPTAMLDRDAAPLSVHSPTALLMRYLSTKIADAITHKIAREAAREDVTL
ncbi:hypothetical protein D9619_011718 [Psilocybe cf. subviscida]|uniref:DNA topoisomerase (ATP-hydrolyzing) n=1 Tax=Psilocybe cf. subviscida TaxID=2480587 RepID=A0A8H5BST7_9AGAR|nr:hypothetical protein D9619_011718 [Psilocybe cf. subviscida]